ncbi:excisionase family DNA-binding protein [Catellatospora sp. NPDC049609]|uniref:helix-turn-helix domain-containing protein n=1 Tax=Catellatospora sp. NPDC049609 TaxID=3155505 RepID=UPI003436B0DD
MESSSNDLLTTTQAAAMLRSSRQHVVDLCERGIIPFVRVGTHRRLARAEVLALLNPELTRDQLRSLWLHRAVAARLLADPDDVLADAVENLRRLQRVHPDGMAAMWLERWRQVLDGGVEAVLEVLTSSSPDAAELRQNSPFAGVLPESTRQGVLAVFAECWRQKRMA